MAKVMRKEARHTQRRDRRQLDTMMTFIPCVVFSGAKCSFSFKISQLTVSKRTYLLDNIRIIFHITCYSRKVTATTKYLSYIQ